MKSTKFGIVIAVLLALSVTLGACARRQPAPAVSIDSVEASGGESGISDEYRLGPGDKLKVVVFGHQDVSGEFVIDGSGNLALPLVGQFKAGALSVPALQESLRQTLNDKYIVNPRVSIEVLNYRPFFILGEVNKPGSYPYVAGIDVTQAVALGGGYTRRARTSSVRITRETGQGRVTLSAAPHNAVLPGDTIEVERRLF